jgi:hypothetical protein
MADLERRALLEGELWARRVREQLETWDGPVQEEWPGRVEEARMLAEMLTDGPKTREKLAGVIQQRAHSVWRLLHKGQV